MERSLEPVIYLALASQLSRAYPDAPVTDIEDAVHFACEQFITGDREILKPHEWLFTVASNRLKSERGRSKKFLALDEVNNSLLSTDDDLHEAELHEVITQLKETDEVAFAAAFLHYEYKQSFDEIAEQLRATGVDLTADAIRMRMYRAFEKARKHVERTQPWLNMKGPKQKRKEEREREREKERERERERERDVRRMKNNSSCSLFKLPL